jgi:hypothetical protein
MEEADHHPNLGRNQKRLADADETTETETATDQGSHSEERKQGHGSLMMKEKVTEHALETPLPATSHLDNPQPTTDPQTTPPRRNRRS